MKILLFIVLLLGAACLGMSGYPDFSRQFDRCFPQGTEYKAHDGEIHWLFGNGAWHEVVFNDGNWTFIK